MREIIWFGLRNKNKKKKEKKNLRHKPKVIVDGPCKAVLKIIHTCLMQDYS